MATSKPELLDSGWEGAGEGCLGAHLAERRFVSLHVGMAGATLSQQAGRASLPKYPFNFAECVGATQDMERKCRVGESWSKSEICVVMHAAGKQDITYMQRTVPNSHVNDGE